MTDRPFQVGDKVSVRASKHTTTTGRIDSTRSQAFNGLPYRVKYDYPTSMNLRYGYFSADEMTLITGAANV